MASHQTYMDDCLAAFKIIDINSLRKLIDAANLELDNRAQAAKHDALEKIRALAAEAGISGDELVKLAKGAPKRQLPPAEIKYKHPSSPTMVWSGRGRQPLWVKQWEDQHGNLDALKVAA